jgi:threonine dehydrogenase-like Zn-dependent dehydrogenase
MKAVCWCGTGKVRVDTVDDPKLLNPRDAIMRVKATAICGSDLHLYSGCIPAMQRGDILGHEFMGEVVELGAGVTNLAVGDRVVVPFAIACGNCFFCKRKLFSLCDNSNPNAGVLEALYGSSGAGIFGYSHLYGGYAGGQAEYVRIPYADTGAFKLTDGVSDEQAIFLGDVLPTGYMAAENCDIQPGDTVAVWGCGPVGLFAIKSAYWLGAERVIGIDRYPDRLKLARDFGADTIDYGRQDVLAALDDMTHGQGPDACIDAVGIEAHGTSVDAIYDRVKHSLYLTTDRLHALREAIKACRKGGTLSVPGVYGGYLDKMPFGAAFAKGIQFRMGQTHVHRYVKPLMERIERGDVDPCHIVSHRGSLDDAPHLYQLFRDRAEGCTKVVLRPGA